jgi:hypothetical protein
MKKLIFTIALAIAGIALHAQVYVNGKDLNELTKGRYLEFETRRIQGTYDFNLAVNYGQTLRNAKNTDFFTDKEGNNLKFNNIIAALNYLEEQGWVYEDFISQSTDFFSGRYLLRRK